MTLAQRYSDDLSEVMAFGNVLNVVWLSWKLCITRGLANYFFIFCAQVPNGAAGHYLLGLIYRFLTIVLLYLHLLTT